MHPNHLNKLDVPEEWWDYHRGHGNSNARKSGNPPLSVLVETHWSVEELMSGITVYIRLCDPG